MTDDLRFGLVGCGRLAERGYVPAMQGTRGIRLAAVADLDADRCKAVAPDLPAHSDVASLVSAGGVDAIVVATPAFAHLADARIATEAGLPVLVEKPPAASIEEARELAALDPRPWIGFNRRFDPGLERLRVTTLGYEQFRLEIELSYRRQLWGAYVVADEAIDDLGSHVVDLARWLSGREIARARALDLEVDRALVELDLGEGRTARLVCAADRGHRESFVLRDARGRRVARHVRDRSRGAMRRLRRPRAPNPLVGSLARELEAFVRAIDGESEPHPASARDGLAAMTVIDTVRRSAADNGRWHDVLLVAERA